MNKKICPNCKKSDIQFFAGGVTGAYRCRCGYVGPIIIEVVKIKKKNVRKQRKCKKKISE